MLTKLINGKTFILSETEERQQRAFWALNDKYPEYAGHCGWDGVNEPYHDMQECRKHHQRLIEEALEKASSDINKQIEIAEEDGNLDLKAILLNKRKSLRSYEIGTSDKAETVDDLKKSIPLDLQPYWNK